MSIYIIILFVFIGCLLIITVGSLYRIEKRQKESLGKVSVNFQRERLENQIYHFQDILMRDRFQLQDANKLLLIEPRESDNNKPPVNPNLSFFQNMGIYLNRIKVKETSAFCLMPFHSSYLRLFITLRNACRTHGITCSRSDIKTEPGDLLRQIVISIAKARYIFAILDGRNPNVFYEIGIAHSIGKQVYLIAHYSSKDDQPFDVASSRLILYKNLDELSRKIDLIIKNDNRGNQ